MKTHIYFFDDLVEIELDVEYTATYQSARVYGPAEDCYPAESDMTIDAWPVVYTKYFGDENDVPKVTQEMIDAEVEACMDRIVTECWEDFHSRGSDYWED